jgi:thiol-disulfide isomerase/thioredoxin
MRTAVILSLLVASFLVQAQTLTFPTGPAELSKRSNATFPMDAEHYAKFVEQMQGNSPIIPIRKIPANLSANARYGYNFLVGGKNRGWIIDGDDAKGWVLYLDWKGDGDLSATAPRPMENINGVYRLRVEASDGELRWPCVFEVGRVSVQGKDELAVSITDFTFRRGEIQIGGKRFPFQVEGKDGIYNRPAVSTVSVDRNGSGELDQYKISDRYINLDDKSYEFTVDASGGSLSLTEMAETQPDRPSLKVGATAPDFVATDIGGGARRLASYKGRMVLVEFWATSCAPCREQAPHMVEFFAGAARDKIDFLGVSSDTSQDTLDHFLREFKIDWPQIREDFDGPLHKLYRVQGMPTYYFIGPNGQILDAWMGGADSVARMEKFLPPK